MTVINYATRTIRCKVVYVGPEGAGKSTNFQDIHRRLEPALHSRLVTAQTGDHALCFDLLTANLGTVQGFRTEIALYAVPGGPPFRTARQVVLKGADGLVFVADSQLGRLEENESALRQLDEGLVSCHLDLGSVPWVIQYNKRDLPNIMTVDLLQKALNRSKVPYVEAVSQTGAGVFPTLKEILQNILARLGG